MVLLAALYATSQLNRVPIMNGSGVSSFARAVATQARSYNGTLRQGINRQKQRSSRWTRNQRGQNLAQDNPEQRLTRFAPNQYTPQAQGRLRSVAPNRRARSGANKWGAFRPRTNMRAPYESGNPHSAAELNPLPPLCELNAANYN